MEATDGRLVTVYALLLGLVAIGSCLESTEGSGDSVWEAGGAPTALVAVLGALLLWAVVPPHATAWPALVLAGTGVGGLIVMSTVHAEASLGAGSELLATAAGLTTVTAVAQLGTLLPRSSAGGGNGS